MPLNVSNADSRVLLVWVLVDVFWPSFPPLMNNTFEARASLQKRRRRCRNRRRRCRRRRRCGGTWGTVWDNELLLKSLTKNNQLKSREGWLLGKGKGYSNISHPLSCLIDILLDKMLFWKKVIVNPWIKAEFRDLLQDLGCISVQNLLLFKLMETSIFYFYCLFSKISVKYLHH